jgi:ATP-dependent Clp protease ATP-binding subunit ClpA
MHGMYDYTHKYHNNFLNFSLLRVIDDISSSEKNKNNKYVEVLSKTAKTIVLHIAMNKLSHLTMDDKVTANNDIRIPYLTLAIPIIQFLGEFLFEPTSANATDKNPGSVVKTPFRMLYELDFYSRKMIYLWKVFQSGDYVNVAIDLSFMAYKCTKTYFTTIPSTVQNIVEYSFRFVDTTVISGFLHITPLPAVALPLNLLMRSGGSSWSITASSPSNNSGSKKLDIEKYPYLEDLTEKAEKGELKPSIIREKELKRIASVLSKKGNNCTVLVGEAGVGKTALVESLAKQIAEGKCSKNLKGKRIVTVDMTALMGGTWHRGSIEARIAYLRQLGKENKNIIFWIDEIHKVIGSGTANAQSVDIANMLKEGMESGDMTIIGATTNNEYKLIETDPAFKRRIPPLYLEPLSSEELEKIIYLVAGKYGDLQNCTYDKDALDYALAQFPHGSEKLSEVINLLDLSGGQVNPDNIENESDSEDEGEVKVIGRVTLDVMKAVAKDLLKLNMAVTQNIPFGVDLTQEASLGKLTPTVGREKEIHQLTRKLARKTNNSIVLLGEAGVGKTALVEKLASMIADGTCHPLLKKKRIISLDINALLATGGSVGQLEKKVEQLLRAVKKDKNVILWIDEIHKLMGAGNYRGSGGGLANKFKEVMERGEVTIIGATTNSEYRIVETDRAFASRLSRVELSPPSASDLSKIINSRAEHLGTLHSCTYTKEALQFAFKLVPDGSLKLRNIMSLIDEAGAEAALDYDPEDSEPCDLPRVTVLTIKKIALEQKYISESDVRV